MKKRLISTLADLPEEFCLKNYEATKDFGIADWLANLEFRALRMNTIDDFSSAKGSAKYILENSLLPFNVCEVFLSMGLSKDIRSSQIKAQSVEDALSVYYFFNDDDRLKKYTDAFLSTVKKDNENVLDAAYSLLSETPMWKAVHESGVNIDGEVDITVNLQASEEQLVGDFIAWIRSAKKELGIEVPKSKISDQELNNLSSFNVLPYLDLVYWAKTQGFDISNQVIGLALFPDEYEIVLSERVRKVVAPLARKVVSFDYCAYLRSQYMALPPESEHRKIVPDEKKVLVKPGDLGFKMYTEDLG